MYRPFSQAAAAATTPIHVHRQSEASVVIGETICWKSTVNYTERGSEITIQGGEFTRAGAKFVFVVVVIGTPALFVVWLFP